MRSTATASPLPCARAFHRFTERRTALSLCFYAIPKGKRYALFPGKPCHTFPGIALKPQRLRVLGRGRSSFLYRDF
ncbi:hypothetical protein FJ978_24450 [Mesorhizobium sp. B1-1-7]|nr:hypothetical protein FJ978_24450 [Mesorhizobium sp. B1-1-7]